MHDRAVLRRHDLRLFVRRWLPVLAAATLTCIIAAPLWAAERQSSIWIMNADGTHPRQLIRLDGHDYHRMPRWSHSGSQIAFYAANKNGFVHEVFVANADGSDPRKLAVGERPDWSPLDKQLLFDDRILPSFVLAIEMLNVDGSGVAQLGKGSIPRWSPDGSHMVILRGGVPLVINLISGQEQPMFEQPLANWGEAIAWSPDGKSLAFIGQLTENGPWQLLIISAQGAAKGKRVRLDHFIGGNVLNYSPDGKQLVFDAQGFIQVIDVEGKALPRVLPDQKGRNLDADFSPDGKQIVFASNREE
jgi:Tol biopolymer transport system component